MGRLMIDKLRERESICGRSTPILFRLLRSNIDHNEDDDFPVKIKYDVTGVSNGLICLSLRTETVKDGFELTWVRFCNPPSYKVNIPKNQHAYRLQSQRVNTIIFQLYKKLVFR